MFCMPGFGGYAKLLAKLVYVKLEIMRFCKHPDSCRVRMYWVGYLEVQDTYNWHHNYRFNPLLSTLSRVSQVILGL